MNTFEFELFIKPINKLIYKYWETNPIYSFIVLQQIDKKILEFEFKNPEFKNIIRPMISKILFDK